MTKRSLSITHYLSQYCPPKLSEAKNHELTARLVEGDLSVIEEIISGHLRLAIYLAGQLSYRSPNKVNDVISVALETMVEGCHKVARDGLQDGNKTITKFLDSLIRTRCVAFLRADYLVRIPYSTLCLEESKGKEILQPRFFPAETAYIYPTNSSVNELMESILACCDGEIERKVIILRSHYFTDEEIASQLNLSYSKVLRIRKKVEKKFYADSDNLYQWPVHGKMDEASKQKSA